jgi:hypothetical protein
MEEFRKWQQGATADAARLASMLAELYVNSIATLTPGGDLVVTLGDVADRGPHWEQFLSILPLVGQLPVSAIVLKLGKRQVRLPKAAVRKLELLTDKERKSILVSIAGAKTDDEAAAIIKREVVRHVGNRQTHHAISETIHTALEKHKNLRGKYQPRDRRFESLAIDYESHHGYEEWHRKLDKEVKRWIDRNKDATEATFEAWLRARYNKPDLKSRFPKGM